MDESTIETVKIRGRFQPGNKGGPGRPKGRLELSTVIRNFLNEYDPEEIKSKKRFKRTRLYMLLERIVKEDPRCILAYGFGKPIETVEVGQVGEATGEKPLGVSKLTPKRVSEIAAWVEKQIKRN